MYCCGHTRRQFAAWRPAAPSGAAGKFSRYSRVVRQYGRQTDTICPTIFDVTTGVSGKAGRFRPAGNGLLPGFFCPLRPAWSVPAGSDAQHHHRHAGDFAAEFTGGFAVGTSVCAKAVHQPVSTRYGGSARRQHLIPLPAPAHTNQQPPRPLRTVCPWGNDADLSGLIQQHTAVRPAGTSSSFATPPRNHSDSLRL